MLALQAEYDAITVAGEPVARAESVVVEGNPLPPQRNPLSGERSVLSSLMALHENLASQQAPNNLLIGLVPTAQKSDASAAMAAFGLGMQSSKMTAPALPAGYPYVTEKLLSELFGLNAVIDLDNHLRVNCTESVILGEAELKVKDGEYVLYSSNSKKARITSIAQWNEASLTRKRIRCFHYP